MKLRSEDDVIGGNYADSQRWTA